MENQPCTDCNPPSDLLQQMEAINQQQDAQYQAAAFMATPVPAVIDSINRGIKNGNANDALASIQMFERLRGLDGNKTIGVDEKTMAVGELFQSFLAGNPNDPNAALQHAKDAIFNKDENIIKLNNLKFIIFS